MFLAPLTSLLVKYFHLNLPFRDWFCPDQSSLSNFVLGALGVSALFTIFGWKYGHSFFLLRGNEGTVHSCGYAGLALLDDSPEKVSVCGMWALCWFLGCYRGSIADTYWGNIQQCSCSSYRTRKGRCLLWASQGYRNPRKQAGTCLRYFHVWDLSLTRRLYREIYRRNRSCCVPYGPKI